MYITEVKALNFSTSLLIDKVVTEFPIRYVQFKELKKNVNYVKYWDKCIEAITDKELLSHIIFCNNIFRIPPVKTFLTYYEKDFVEITGKEDAELDIFVKKSIGAFWGMVFKFVLGYQGQKSTTVSMNKKFKVSTATYFENPKEKIILE